MSALATIAREPPSDPSSLGWPPTFPIELALAQLPVRDICESYGIERALWDELRCNPLLVAEVAQYREELKKTGMSFKLKARLQAEEMLKTSWNIAHDPETPPNVRADLIKFTIRAAGLDGSRDQAAAAVGNLAAALQININLG